MKCIAIRLLQIIKGIMGNPATKLTSRLLAREKRDFPFSSA